MEIWADVIENFDKNHSRHGGYIERRLKLLIGSAWLRALAFFTSFAFFFDIHWSIFNYPILEMLIFPFLFIVLFDYFIIFYRKKYTLFQHNRLIKTNGKIFAVFFVILPALISIIAVLNLLR